MSDIGPDKLLIILKEGLSMTHQEKWDDNRVWMSKLWTCLRERVAQFQRVRENESFFNIRVKEIYIHGPMFKIFASNH